MEDILELGHATEERIMAALHDLAESDAREVAFDCLVLEVLLTEMSGKLAQGGFRCRVWLDARAGAKFNKSFIA